MTDIDRIWYGRSPLAWLLLPLSVPFCAAVVVRRWMYGVGLKTVQRVGMPVIVVGNITAGGTGKTPLVIWLAQLLKAHGYRPGLIARGYGGGATKWPQAVTPDSDPAMVGDEPVLLARTTGCPMVVAPDRVAAARTLLETYDCNMILSDDGLQHYALGRDIEIAVIDGARRFGNGHCLPAGPLREPPSRLRQVDLIVANGSPAAGEFAMRVQTGEAVNLLNGERRPLTAFSGQPVHAVAGIGHPARFFTALQTAGLDVRAHTFPDHHAYRMQDLNFTDGPVLMTAKDAVKCRRFARPDFWSVETSMDIDPAFSARLLALLSDLPR